MIQATATSLLSSASGHAQVKDDRLIAGLAKKIGSPSYLYFEEAIDENIEMFADIPYEPTSIHFATMANDNPILLSILKEAGFGVFVNSLKHLTVAKKCGFATDEVIFASTGISPRLMKSLINQNVPINIDSIQQLKQFGVLAPGQKIGIRINIDEKSKNDPHNGLGSRIGVLQSEFDAVKRAAKKYGLQIAGTHIYPGTDIVNMQDSLAAVQTTLDLSDHFPDIEFVDLGGGFPIDRGRFDIATYKSEVAEMMVRYSRKRGRDIRLVVEPGRAMFGDTAVFISEVTDVKVRPDRAIVTCDGSASLLPRAMFYEDYNPVRAIGNLNHLQFQLPVDIAGSTTYSRDYLSRKTQLPIVEPGNLLVFENAGSYCYSMITRFLGQALPPEYMYRKDGTLQLIRPGETFPVEVM